MPLFVAPSLGNQDPYPGIYRVCKGNLKVVGFGFKGLGFGVWSLGFGVWGLGFRV